MESAIGAVVVGIAAVVPSTGDGYRTRTRLIGCIGVDFENHITGSVTGDMFGMGGEVVEEAPSGSNSVLGGVGLCGRDVVASRKDEWVLDASIIEKVTPAGSRVSHCQMLVENYPRSHIGWAD